MKKEGDHGRGQKKEGRKKRRRRGMKKEAKGTYLRSQKEL
jgi:hypothetical protein